MQFAYDYAIPCFISTATHPLTYARTMMLLGYEPDPPVPKRTIMSLFNPSHRVYYYPSVFTYLRRLREEVGLLGLFTIGLPASICGSFVRDYTTEKIMEQISTNFYGRKTFYETGRGVKIFVINTWKLAGARVAGIVVSYPFQVVMIRQMAQFANQTDIYKYLLWAFPSIVKSEGISSLFSGLIPRVIGEVITVWLTACLAYFFNQYVFTRDVNPELKRHTPLIAGMMVSGATHRLTVVSAVMAASDSRLEYALMFKNWWECYNYLNQTDSFVRGTSLFFRRAPKSVVPAYLKSQ